MNIRPARRWSIALSLLTLVGCRAVPSDRASTAELGPTQDVASDTDAAVSQLAKMMTGWFDSSEQAAADPEGYFHIRLVMLPIWEERDDGRWLYVEQAAASALARPYRQRVYHLHGSPSGEIVSDVYAFRSEPLRHANAWARAAGLQAIDHGELVLRDGCSITLHAAEGSAFEGGTHGSGCSSALGDAAHATSEVRIEPTRLVSWDRGWTDDGE